MNLIVNGKAVSIEGKDSLSLSELEGELLKSESHYFKTNRPYDVRLVNGFTAKEDHLLKDRDEVILIQKGVIPEADELEVLMCARHTPQVHQVFKAAKVAIAGLGGLGSNIAIALARVGIGELLLVDFDVVEPSNLNRQAYYMEDLGLKKSDALIRNLKRINPYNTYIGLHQKIEKEDVKSLFEGYDLVVEAFDDPSYKAMLVNEVLTTMKVPIVSASGLAGMYNPNTIVSKKELRNLYLVGDGIHEAKANEGLMAPRVLIAAGHQATVVCQLLLGQVEL